jgi:ribosome-associated protein
MVTSMSDGDLYINARISIPHWELIFTASRSAGPGGQHANKTSSRVTLHWSVKDTAALTEFQKSRVLRRLGPRLTQDGSLQLHVEDTRSQHRNKEVAKERLIALLRDALKVPKRRQATKPSKAAKRRRTDDKKSRGTLKKLRKKPVDD